MKEKQYEEIDEAMRQLTATLHEQCLFTKLITIEQWNEEIAPRLSALAMAIDGGSVTARTYKMH